MPLISRCEFSATGADNFESYQKHFTAMNFMDGDEGDFAILFYIFYIIFQMITHSTFMFVSPLECVEISDIRGKGVRVRQDIAEFETAFNSQYGESHWKSVQAKIDRMLVSIFSGVASILHTDRKHPLDGQLLHPNAGWSLDQPNACPARAMYGIDILLRKRKVFGITESSSEGIEIEPTLLEVQWGADAQKALEFHPSFWDDILEYLYLGKALSYSLSLPSQNNLLFLLLLSDTNEAGFMVEIPTPTSQFD